MLRLFRKAQQAYIADRLCRPDRRCAWAKKDEFILLPSPDGTYAYVIPEKLCYLRLEDEKESPGLAFLLQDPPDPEPAEPVGVDMKGLMRLESKSHAVYADAKLLKPFLAVEGVSLMVNGPIKPIRVYSYGNLVGIVLSHKPPAKEGARG